LPHSDHVEVVMKRFLAVLLAAVLALGLAACGDDDDSGAADTGASSTPAAADLGLRTPGVLTVASDIPYAPFEFTDPGSTEPKGFDVDLTKAIAETQGITDVRFVDQGFDSIILSIKQGRFDMSASSWTITPERAKQVDFGDGYFSANQAILVQADDDSVTTLDDLQGRTIGAQRGTVGADLGNTVEGATVQTYDTADDAFNALAQGRVDAAITDFRWWRTPRSRSPR
jgi:polar amino acid transport system substrate-binding protein